ncbi:hypothetical protein [Shewanella nanhaiensis]|uniref:Uncharacterized protein n=1 Tax=Shewanella nanhaiensis TaxID=2864872 RepID=A0ABS7E264_9GAMM|nr:hypothetical protein [Shewanella nanhaiensis]MBW8183789.1 hypothetical protein [Shewanella nanhaiensis]
MNIVRVLLKNIMVVISSYAVSFIVYAGALPSSATILEFAEKDILFVADSDASQIVAYKLPPQQAAKTSSSYNLEGIGTKIAKQLSVGERSISYHDIAVHPVSKEVYISLSVLKENKTVPLIMSVNQSGNLTEINLKSLDHSVKKLVNTATDTVKFWRDIPATTLAITDLDYINGNLYVSSLSTGEFASTLRKVSYPFDKSTTISSIEIYHAVHDQTETRAPIRAMAVLEIGGVETVVAAYTCTPLVTIPTSALDNGAHVKGKTIAELGYGNTPLDVIYFSALNNEQKKEEFVLVIHKERSADLIRVADLVEANKQEGLSTPEMWAKAGVVTRPVPLAGVLQAADQDEQFIATLKRNLITGDIDLVSFRKGAYFRLNDFISEYNFPDYQYVPEQDMFRNYQNLLKTDSDYGDLIRQQQAQKEKR